MPELYAPPALMSYGKVQGLTREIPVCPTTTTLVKLPGGVDDNASTQSTGGVEGGFPEGCEPI